MRVGAALDVSGPRAGSVWLEGARGATVEGEVWARGLVAPSVTSAVVLAGSSRGAEGAEAVEGVDRVGGGTIPRLANVPRGCSRGVRVALMGSSVVVSATARLVATSVVGPEGEGATMVVGGGFRGSRVGEGTVSKETHIEHGAVVDASVQGRDGTGGCIVVWADGVTRFQGSLLARGGAGESSGGTVEVSGRQGLEFEGAVHVQGASAGTLVLDPKNVLVQHALPQKFKRYYGDDEIQAQSHEGYLPNMNRLDGVQRFDAYKRPIDPTIAAGLFYISPEAVMSMLQHSHITIAATNNITVNDQLSVPLSVASAHLHYNTLIFDAGERLLINAPISVRGSILMQSEKGTTILSDVYARVGAHVNSDFDNDGVGALTIAPGKTLSTDNHPVVITAADLDFQGSVDAGTSTLLLRSSHNRDIGMGTTTKQLTLSDSELGRVTSRGGLTVGDNTNSDITINGISQGSSDEIGTLTLFAQRTSAKVVFDTSSSVFDKGLVIRTQGGGVDFKGSVTTNSQPVQINTGAGRVTVAAGKTVSTSGQVLTITTDNFELNGAVSSGAANTVINCFTPGRAINMGSGIITGNSQFMEFDSTEVQRIYATGLTLGGPTCGSQTINSILAENSDNIAALTTLLAVRDDATVTFHLTSSTFNALVVQSDSGVTVRNGLSTDTGYLLINADIESDASGDVLSDIVLTGHILYASTVLTLVSHSGDITRAGALTLGAARGIVLHESLRSAASNTDLHLYRDTVVTQDGVLTLASGKSITTADGDVRITAWDVDLQGSLNAGTAQISIHSSNLAETIGLGSATRQLSFSDAELGRMTATGGLTVGSTANSHIAVAGITVESSDQIGTLTLLSQRSGSRVEFVNASSTFDKGMKVETTAGIVVGVDVTTKVQPVELIAGTGALTVASGKSLKTTNQILTVTADTTDINGDVDTGTAKLILECTTAGRTVGLGTGAGQYALAGTQYLKTTNGVTINAAGNCGDFTVNGADFSNVLATTSLIANRNGATVTFSGVTSSFHDVKTYADAGMSVTGVVKSTYANLHLDADYDNDNSDGNNRLEFAANVLIKAKDQLTLEAHSGSMRSLGALTFEAGSGIRIHNGIAAQPRTPLVISAGIDHTQEGIITVDASQTITTGNSDTMITAWDLNLQGSLDAGTAEVSIHSRTSQTISLGTNTKDMTVSEAEISRISAAGGLTVGSSINSHITVGGITQQASDEIGTLTLLALQPNKIVEFKTDGSLFQKGIVIQAEGGIDVDADLITQNDATLLWAGTGGLTVASTKSLKTTNQMLTITADTSDINGDVDSGAGKLIFECTTAGRPMYLGSRMMQYAATGWSYGLAGTQYLKTTRGLTIGAAGNCGSFAADTADFTNVLATTSLMAIRNGAILSFTGGTSAFHEVMAYADAGMSATGEVTTVFGKIHLDADADNNVTDGTTAALRHWNASAQALPSVANSNMYISAGARMKAKSVLTLEASSGSLLSYGDLTLEAGTGIVVQDDLTSIGQQGSAIVINSDYELPGATITVSLVVLTVTPLLESVSPRYRHMPHYLPALGNGMLTLAARKSVNSNDGDITLTTWDLDLGGSLSTKTLSIHGSKSDQTILLGAVFHCQSLGSYSVLSFTVNH